jgi:hypothetical protein
MPGSSQPNVVVLWGPPPLGRGGSLHLGPLREPPCLGQRSAACLDPRERGQPLPDPIAGRGRRGWPAAGSGRGARRCIEIWPGFGACSSSPGRGARAQGGVYKTLGSERGQGSGEGREEEEEDPRRPHLAGVVSAGELAGGGAVAAPRTAASATLGVAIRSEWRERERGARRNGCKE